MSPNIYEIVSSSFVLITTIPTGKTISRSHTHFEKRYRSQRLQKRSFPSTYHTARQIPPNLTTLPPLRISHELKSHIVLYIDPLRDKSHVLVKRITRQTTSGFFPYIAAS